MVDRDDEGIARQEANETFQSITDLDEIADTMFIAITFLLAALASWTTFAFDRVDGIPLIEQAYIVFAVSCAGMISVSVYFLASSLSPRGFYGQSVGQKFLNHQWLLWRNQDPVDVEMYHTRRQNIDSEADLKAQYEEWLDEYDPGTSISSRESFEFSRLLNYKYVARQKARNVAYGVALLRIAVILLAIIIFVSLLAPFAS